AHLILQFRMRNNFVDLSKRVYVTPQEKLLLLVKTFSKHIK
ncbi:phytoene/squalene synthase family protein, partial [Limosilactobacillus fermentum]